MKFIAGVDGGQSSTTAAVADENGRILGRGAGPAADLVGEPRGSQRQRNAVAVALAAALRDAGLPNARVAALVVGLTGHDAGTTRPPSFEGLADSVAVVHDTVTAHAGALGGQPGIVVLAGTGSVALGNSVPQGPFVRAGGWGYFFGDWGSALWIAREAVGSAMRDFDKGESSQLRDAALRFFRLPDLRAIQHAFARGELSRATLAAFAVEVLTMAPMDQPSIPTEAWHVRNKAVNALTDLARVVDQRLPAVTTRRISYAGGLFADVGLRRTFRHMIESRATPSGRAFEGARVDEPAGDALDGALSLARRLLIGEPVEVLFADG